MAEAMVGEIRFFPYSFAPECWFTCDGRQIPIRGYEALYAIIGATYGGDHKTYFNVPNLCGAVPTNQGQGPGLSLYQIGHAVGTEGVSLTNPAQLPAHTHTLNVQFLGYGQEPQDYSTAPKAGVSYAARYWYNLTARPVPSYLGYNPVPPTSGTTAPAKATPMAARALDPQLGSAQPHENRQPYLPLRPCICWNGYFMPNPG